MWPKRQQSPVRFLNPKTGIVLSCSRLAPPLYSRFPLRGKGCLVLGVVLLATYDTSRLRRRTIMEGRQGSW